MARKPMLVFLHSSEVLNLLIILIGGTHFVPVVSEIVENELKIHMCCPLDLNRGMVSCGNANKHSHEDDFLPSESFFVPTHLMAENISTTFGLSVRKAPCLETEWEKVYLSLLRDQGRSSLFIRNGYLKIESDYYHMEEYCINGKNDTMLEINVCPQDCKGPRPCITKCCGLEKIYSFGFSPHSRRKGCQNPGDEYFSPQLYTDFHHTMSNPKALAPHYLEKYPSIFKYQCHQNRTAVLVFPTTSQVIKETTGFNLTGHQFRIREDGKFLVQSEGKCSVVDPFEETICVDGIIDYGPESLKFRNDPEEMVIFLCARPPSEEEEESGLQTCNGGWKLSSSIILLVTIGYWTARLV